MPHTTIPEIPALRDFYDPAQVSDEEFEAEQRRVFEETAIERHWQQGTDLEPFASSHQLEAAIGQKILQKVVPTTGLIPIYPLRTWSKESSYSPPYLRPRAWHVLRFIGENWHDSQGNDQDGAWFLSVTSLVRSTQYQAGLRAQSQERHRRKIAIDPHEGIHSSHEYGVAFDIDGCGMYRFTNGRLESVNPQSPHPYNHKVEQSRNTLRAILRPLQAARLVNVCEEVPGSKQWCFHICVNPAVSHGRVLDLRLQNARTPKIELPPDN